MLIASDGPHFVPFLKIMQLWLSWDSTQYPAV